MKRVALLILSAVVCGCSPGPRVPTSSLGGRTWHAVSKTRLVPAGHLSLPVRGGDQVFLARDGTLLATGDGALFRFDPRGGVSRVIELGDLGGFATYSQVFGVQGDLLRGAAGRSRSTINWRTGERWASSFPQDIGDNGTLNRDGTLFATTAEDDAGRPVIRLYRAGKKNAVRTFTAPDDHLSDFQFSPNNAWLVAGTSDSGVLVWNLESGQRRQFPALQPVTTGGWDGPLAFSPDGRALITNGPAGRAFVLDLASGRSLPLRARVEHAAWAEDGRRIALAGSDAVVVVDARTRASVLRFRPNVVLVNGVAWGGPQGRHLALLGDGHAQVFDGRGRRLRDVRVDGRWVEELAVSSRGLIAATVADEQMFVVPLAGGRVRTWRIKTPDDPMQSPFAVQLAFDPGGRHLASVWTNGSVRLTDTATGRELPPLRPPDPQGTPHEEAIGRRVAWRPDGGALTITQGSVEVLDARTRRATAQLHGREGREYSLWAPTVPDGWHTVYADVQHAALSPDGRWALASGWGGLSVWPLNPLAAPNAAGVHTPSRILAPKTSYADATFTPDGKWVVASRSSGDIDVWDAVRWRHVARVAGQVRDHSPVSGREYAHVAVSADGRYALVMHERAGLTVLDLAGRAVVARLPVEWAPAAFAPDGRTIIVGRARPGEAGNLSLYRLQAP